MPMDLTQTSVTIAAGQSLSSAVAIGPKSLLGLYMPAAWTAAGLTFQVSPDGGATWYEHTGSDGTETSFTVAAGQYIAINPSLWCGIYLIKVRSGTLASPVNQGAAATLQLVAGPLI